MKRFFILSLTMILALSAWGEDEVSALTEWKFDNVTLTTTDETMSLGNGLYFKGLNSENTGYGVKESTKNGTYSDGVLWSSTSYAAVPGTTSNWVQAFSSVRKAEASPQGTFRRSFGLNTAVPGTCYVIFGTKTASSDNKFQLYSSFKGSDNSATYRLAEADYATDPTELKLSITTAGTFWIRGTAGTYYVYAIRFVPETVSVPTINNNDGIITLNSGYSNLSGDENVVIKTYYTLDGSDPTTESTEYTGTFEVTSSCMVKAISINTVTGTASAIASEVVTITSPVVTTYNISGASESNGIAVDKTSAAEGETVTITMTVPEGYQLTSGKPTVRNGETYVEVSAIEGQANKFEFTMPAGDVTITASFKKIQYKLTKSVSNGSLTLKYTNDEGEEINTGDSGIDLDWGTTIYVSASPSSEDYYLSSLTYGETALENNSTFSMPSSATEVTATFTAKNTPAVTKVADFTYDGQSHNLITATSYDATLSYAYKVGDGNFSDWFETIPSATNADTYTVKWKATGGSTSIDVSETTLEAVTISKANYTVEGTATATATYGTQVNDITISGLTVKDVSGNAVAGEWKFPEEDTAVLEIGNTTEKTATFTPTTPNNNYNVATKTIIPTITGNATATAPTLATGLTYTGTAQDLISTPGSATNGTIKYYATTDNTKTSSNLQESDFSADTPQGTSAGTYYIWYYADGDVNYTDTEFTKVEGSVTISQVDVTIKALDQTIDYGNSIATTVDKVSVTTDNLVSGHMVSSVTLTASTEDVTDAGTISIASVVIKDNNGEGSDVTSNYNITKETGILTITAVSATATAPTLATELTYTGAVQNLISAAGTATGGTMKYYVTTNNSKTSSDLQESDFSADTPQITDAGTYYIWYYTDADANHIDVPFTKAEGSVTIVQANFNSVEIAEVSNQSYTGSAIEPTPAVTLGGVAIAAGEKTFGYSYQDNTVVGTSAKVILTPANDGNFSGDPREVTFTIVEASMDITVTAYEAAYDGAAHSITLSNVPNDATVKYRTTDSGDYNLDDNPTYTDVGTYTVYYKITKEYYSEVTGSSTVTITQATNSFTTQPTITGWAYGAAANEPTDGVVKFGEIVYKYCETADGTYSTYNDVVNGVIGTWYVKGFVEGTTNYTTAESNAIEFQIIPATLTATAQNASRNIGEANPEFTVVVTGFVNGETADNAAGYTAPTANCAANEESSAGTYDIIPSGGTATNYTFNYVNGTLTVNATTVQQNDSGDSKTTESYSITDATHAEVTTVTTTEGATSVTIPASVNGVFVTSIATTAFDNVADKSDIKSIDLSATSITGVEVNRSSGVFSGFSEETIIFMPASNTVADGQKNVVIGGTCANFEMVNESSYSIPKDFTATNATLSREFTSDVTCTICLPYDVPAGNLRGKIYQFSEVEGTTVKMTENENGLVANTPYIFVPNADATAITATGSINVSMSSTPNTSPGGQSFTFKGVYEHKKFSTDEISSGVYGFAADNNHGASVGEFTKAANGAWIQGMRAYLAYSGNLTDTNVASTRGTRTESLPEKLNVVLVNAKGETTNIGRLELMTAEDGSAIYNLNGQRVDKSYKGIVIKHGKKVVIK